MSVKDTRVYPVLGTDEVFYNAESIKRDPAQGADEVFKGDPVQGTDEVFIRDPAHGADEVFIREPVQGTDEFKGISPKNGERQSKGLCKDKSEPRPAILKNSEIDFTNIRVISEFNFDNTDLNPQQIHTLKQTICKYAKVFEKPTPSNPAKVVGHNIDTANNMPINQVPYRAGFKERQVIEEHVKKMLDDGVIKE